MFSIDLLQLICTTPVNFCVNSQILSIPAHHFWSTLHSIHSFFNQSVASTLSNLTVPIHACMFTRCPMSKAFIDAYCCFNEIKCSELWSVKQQQCQRTPLVHHKNVPRRVYTSHTHTHPHTHKSVYVSAVLTALPRILGTGCARLVSSKVVALSTGRWLRCGSIAVYLNNRSCSFFAFRSV